MGCEGDELVGLHSLVRVCARVRAGAHACEFEGVVLCAYDLVRVCARVHAYAYAFDTFVHMRVNLRVWCGVVCI